MILGIGTDIADIKRIGGVLEQHGERFRERCFAEEERAAAASAKDAAAFYAKRWAAKEAAAKALGLGIRDNIFLKDIVVTNDGMGKPALSLRGGAKERLAAITPAGTIAHIHVSLADDPPMAMAFVVISAEK